MRREFVTIDELEAKLREAGAEHIGQVRRAYMESDGEITLLLADDAVAPPGGAKALTGAAAPAAAEPDPRATKGPRRRPSRRLT